MGKVINAFPGGIVTVEQQNALLSMGDAIEAAVVAAHDAGVPQGLIVAVLHACAHRETAEMLNS